MYHRVALKPGIASRLANFKTIVSDWGLVLLGAPGIAKVGENRLQSS
jgi:hypothetical protein